MAKARQLQLDLTPELAKLMDLAMATGRFSSADEIVVAALREFRRRLADQDERREEIGRALAAAADNPERLSDEQVSARLDALLADHLARAS